jgi:hypothetical protein
MTLGLQAIPMTVEDRRMRADWSRHGGWKHPEIRRILVHVIYLYMLF